MEIKQGDVFSQISHYVATDTNGLVYHVESDTNIILPVSHISLLKSAQHFTKTIIVGKEDKKWTTKQIEEEEKRIGRTLDFIKVGDVRVNGIRTIWENIYDSQVFTVCWDKNPKAKSNKIYQAELEERTKIFLEGLAKAKKSKKSMTKYVEKNLPNLECIFPYEIEERIVAGYKVQFKSRNGMYNIIEASSNSIKQVNINTIKWLIFDGIKYVVCN